MDAFFDYLFDCYSVLKGYSTFLEIGSFYNSKQLGFTVFESIQPKNISNQTVSGPIDLHSIWDQKLSGYFF